MKAIVDIKSKLPGHPTEMIVPLEKLDIDKPPSDPAKREVWMQELKLKLEAYVFDCADEDFKVMGWRVEK